jgi:glycine betaine/proline transport system ATP-binding protein
MAIVEFRGVDILFGRKVPTALKLLDEGAARDRILAETGCVLGAAGVSLAVERGEICVLMGLSGSGKSTLLRAVNRLNRVTRGTVLVEHRGQSIDVAHCDDATLRDVRMHSVSTVFQQFALLPWRTVRENVGFGLELRGLPGAERNAIVDEKLELVGLGKWAEKQVHELSGGMQQRVGLARAFATDPEILLMDEPFSALDPLIRTKLQDELLELQQRLHKTIIFVSHDLDEALKLGNRIAIMEGGRVVQLGTGEEILLRPADSYVAEFVKHMNPINVLRGHSVMRPVSLYPLDGDTLLIDRNGWVKIRLDPEGRPAGVTFDGVSGRLALAEDEAAEGADLLIAPMDLTLRAIAILKRRTARPLLMVDATGRLAGICGDAEIYDGLLRGIG